ncbi:MAG: hypothetical protein RLZZ450_7307 [Pseudomonadota bacterium]|jgi:hypothetical protein
MASEAVRLQESLSDLDAKGVLRSDLHQEWFRQLVRDFLKESGREEDELHREQLRHVVLHGSSRESPPERASIYFEIARRLSGQDIDLLKSLRDTGEAYETAYDSHPDVGVLRRDLLAKLGTRFVGLDESWVLLVREGLKEGPPGTAITSGGRENHPFRLTYAGLNLLEWVSWPPAITV